MDLKSKILLASGTIVILIFLFLGVFFLSTVKKEAPSQAVLAPTQSPQPISTAKAESIIKGLPEVSKFIESPDGKNTTVSIEKTNPTTNTVTLEVSNIVTDAPGENHSTAFNWYILDKNTGTIKCSMYIYDSEGTFIRAAEPDEFPCD